MFVIQKKVVKTLMVIVLKQIIFKILSFILKTPAHCVTELNESIKRRDKILPLISSFDMKYNGRQKDLCKNILYDVIYWHINDKLVRIKSFKKLKDISI